MEVANLVANCGTYCGVCPYLIAYKTNDEHLKEKLAKSAGLKPEQIVCEGCNSDLAFIFCRTCDTKKCVQEKGIESCSECGDFPCELVERWEFEDFKNRIKMEVNYRKQYGKEKWIAKSIEMNTCPSCQTLCHWMATVCKSCGTHLEPRYIDENDIDK